jgi:hypothetical protein
MDARRFPADAIRFTEVGDERSVAVHLAMRPTGHHQIMPENEKTRFAQMAKRVFSVRGGNPRNDRSRLQRVFKRLTGNELDGLRSLDLDLLTSLRIDASAGFAGSNFESAETNKLNVLGLLDSDLDRIDHRVNRALGFCFAGFFAEGLLDGFDEFDFVHKKGNYCLRVWVSLAATPQNCQHPFYKNFQGKFRRSSR